MATATGALAICIVACAVYVVWASDSYLINCGGDSTDDGRTWTADSSAENVSRVPDGVAAEVKKVGANVPYPNVYRTYRIFQSEGNYTFKIGILGRHWIRLHFYPFTFQGYTPASSSVFSVYVGSLSAVSSLNVSDEIARQNADSRHSSSSRAEVHHLMKEYSVYTNSSEVVIRFVPQVGSFAFINAIELISMPNGLFPDSVNAMGSASKKVSSAQLDYAAIETMYRLNVGGKAISAEKDSDLSRRWEEDEYYMYTAAAGSVMKNKSAISYGPSDETFIAPLDVYATARVMTNNQVIDRRFNISWIFDADPGFEYLIRFHFCELEYSKPNQRVFRIYINNETAANGFDVYALAGAENTAMHSDYITSLKRGVDSIWIQIGPDPSTATTSGDADAILNGLEIFKMSNADSLAGSSHEVADSVNQSRNDSKSRILWACIGAGAGIVLVAFAVVSLLCCRRRRQKQTGMPVSVKPNGNASTNGWLPLFLVNGTESTKNTPNTNAGFGSVRRGRRFSIADIRTATHDFDESRLIGVGGFGKVYRGELEGGLSVAIKRANPQSEQGVTEFETEIELLSQLRHRHLVSLIGYCDDHSEMILVYEYMANGTLRSHLFGTENRPPLTWKQRLEICIGAARGLHYLHTGADRGIIHRDVKTTNILLDENFVAKMSDFGLSKTGPAFDHTHVSTAVKGSFGYLDPEYFRRQQLTQKSDVYSFGVVLFEVVCARPVINPSLPKEQVNLAEWALQWQQKGLLHRIIDPRLAGACNVASLQKFGEIAEKCLAEDGKNRPTMGDVLWNLEYVLQLHEAEFRNADFCSATLRSASAVCRPENDEATMIADDRHAGPGGDADLKNVAESEEAAGVAVFSQIVKPQGR